jgi:uncharacterized surface protein with fasciclin (FAS1) repeats
MPYNGSSGSGCASGSAYSTDNSHHMGSNGYDQTCGSNGLGQWGSGTTRRQQLINQLLAAAQSRLFGNDQGLPLEKALPSPFGQNYSSGRNYWPSLQNADPNTRPADAQTQAAIDRWMGTWTNPSSLLQAKGQSVYPPIRSTADLLNRTSVFPTLNSLLNRGGLTPTLTNLEQQGPLVVFAPTEEAFRRLEKRNPWLFQRLQDPRNVSALNTVLKYHVSQASRNQVTYPVNNLAIDSLTSQDGIKYSGNAFQGQIQSGNQLVTTGRALKLPNNTLLVPIDDVLIPPGLDLSHLTP